MKIFHRVVNSLVSRLSLGRADEREVIETALRQLPRAAYWRLREQGFAPGGIVDVGAHEGQWTRMIREIFPSAPILMIEARQEQKPTLQRVCAELPDVELAIALLGRESLASAPFQVSGTGSSIFPERSNAIKVPRMIPMCTLDHVLSSHERIAQPLFLKLDVQGGELECLRGGNVTLAKAEVVQLEVALLNYNEGAPPATEVISFMGAGGFTMFDIAGLVRPNGIDLVQIDIIFVRATSGLRPDFFHFRQP